MYRGINIKRLRDAGIAVVPVGILVIGMAIWLVKSWSQSPAVAPPTSRLENQRGKAPIADELVTAIRNSDEQAIEKWLDTSADVNARDADGNTPLILVSFYASPKCVDLLIEKGADINAANNAGVTPLIRAATHYEKSRLLLDSGANVRVRTALGNTPLILAARRPGNSRTVQLLLDRGASVAERNDSGVGPVLAAAASGDLETMQLLLAAGGKVDELPEPNGPKMIDLFAGIRTPLMWAAHQNNVQMVRLLLEEGANPNQSTYFGTPLSHACWSDSLQAAEVLIAHGANVDIRDAIANFTPLHWAAGTEMSRTQLVKLLLDHGADPNAGGGEPVGAFELVPQTPRLIAEKRGRTAVVDTLVAAGAKEPPQAGKVTLPQRVLPEVLETSTLIASTERALAALQATATKSRESFLQHISKQDCVSCHQQYLPMAAVGHARSRSVSFDHEAAKEHIDSLSKLTNPFFDQEYISQTLLHPDPSHTFGYHLFALVAEGVPPSANTDALIHHLITIQAADGRWFKQMPRPPSNSSDITATALSIHAIKHYGWPGRKEEFVASIERAHQWLWKVQAETNEEAVFQLLGLHWAGEPAEHLAGLCKLLSEKQRKDGGWAQLPMLQSDAYATGQALYTLAQVAKVPVTDPAWQRGLRFLLQRQEDGGSWHVVRRAFPFQPTMNSGFPHDRDSWISASATSWAVLALTQALPVGSAPAKHLVSQTPEQLPNKPNKTQEIDFASQIKPLFERSCVACHRGEKPRGLFRMDSREAMVKGGSSGRAAIVPRHSERSMLIEFVAGTGPDSVMPPRAVQDRFPALTMDEITLLRTWIDQGAKWPEGVPIVLPKIVQ